MIAGLLATAAVAVCPAGSPAALQLSGVPASLVSGRSYTAALVPTGVGETTGSGWTLGVYDRLGRGYSADLPELGFRQAFSVGLTGAPYAVSATYSELVGGAVCTRVLTVSAGVERRVLGLVSCRAAAVEPRTLSLGCGRRKLRDLRWRDWNAPVTVGRGAGGVRVRLSRPEECVSVGGFVYTRAQVGARRYALECPPS